MKNTFQTGKIPEYDLKQTVGHEGRPIKIVKAEQRSFQEKAVFLSPHRKHFYHFVYVKKGTGRHWVDMVPYYLKPDTFYITVPEQVHLAEEVTLTGTLIFFKRDYFALNNKWGLEDLPVIKNSHKAYELILQFEEVKYIEDLLEKLHAEYEKENLFQQEMLDTYMQALLIYLSRIYECQYENSIPVPNRQLLTRFQECIKVRFKELHEVAAYAKLLNISTSHLNNLVREQSGRSAMEHIHERLVLEGKRLLFNTSMSVKEIAFELGFNDDSYFNRFFKRYENTTPTAYRSNIRQMYR